MYKRLAVLLLLVVLVVPGRSSAQTDLNALKSVVDSRLETLWDVILTRQTLYYQMNGRFFQGLVTHGTIPADGGELFPDMQSSKPTDQAENWIDFLDTNIPASLPMALKIDTYAGPGGDGFTATIYVYANGELYSRSKSVGPQADERTRGWYQVVNE